MNAASPMPGNVDPIWEAAADRAEPVRPVFAHSADIMPSPSVPNPPRIANPQLWSPAEADATDHGLIGRSRGHDGLSAPPVAAALPEESGPPPNRILVVTPASEPHQPGTVDIDDKQLLRSCLGSALEDDLRTVGGPGGA
jgi:hypothetical protein